MSGGISEVYAEEGERWLRVSPGHAVSERWLHERAADLYAEWWATTGAAQRDKLALRIEQHVEELEATGSGRQADRLHQQPAPSELADRVAGYEKAAERLGAIALDDPARTAADLEQLVDGDALCDALAATPAGHDRDLLGRRLDAADLMADRPFIDAVSGMTVEVDRLAVPAFGRRRRGCWARRERRRHLRRDDC